MKHIRISLITLALLMANSIFAQQVATLYFLENAPMRHIVNPALQPVSDGYINFTPFGYTSMWVGNNSLTMSDVVFKQGNTTMTVLHPQADRSALLKSLRGTTLYDADGTFNILSFGFRLKNQKGYVHIGIQERIEAGIATPEEYYLFLLDGGMKNITGVNSFDLHTMGHHTAVYTEIAGGYSHKINDQWTVGGKIKLLLGSAYSDMRNNQLILDASHEAWHLYGDGSITLAAPVNYDALPEQLTYDNIRHLRTGDLFKNQQIFSMVKPSGYGAALDLGFSYKPHPQVQITAALNDLGFIVWNNGLKYSTNIDSTFLGVTDLEYNRYSNDANNNSFDSKLLMDDVVDRLENFAHAIHSTSSTKGFTRMLSMKLNVGVDANFWKNRVGLGVLSKTRLYNNRLYTELTLGAAFRPVNWFNIAATYSLIQNGKYSNFGVGLSLMPYDGINFTLAMDYIPTSYAYHKNAPIPYRAKGMNIVFGFSIVWGTNHKHDDDKDGVWNQLDVCPNTPKNIKVDELGCPLDSDGDGVPDYLDNCPCTSELAYGLVDTVGCPLDSDGDGVPDYLDLCPHTPAEAIGYLDEHGCELDTDGDGVPDWRDSCLNTPREAWGFVDENGCELDTDGDGVPDWKDLCPNTPEAARGYIDSVGCELDTDGDGVPDYLDQCPTQAGPAYNSGCPEVKKEIRNLLQKAMQGIQFETGKSAIKKVSYPLLNEIAQTFIENNNYIIEVQGHTDNVGKEEYNYQLSEGRAKAVMDYLIAQGVPANRLSYHGYGPSMPIDDNKTKAGRAKNRRVEFNITFEEITYETILNHVDSTLYQQHLDSIQSLQLPEDSIKTTEIVETTN